MNSVLHFTWVIRCSRTALAIANWEGWMKATLSYTGPALRDTLTPSYVAVPLPTVRADLE